ncbi:MAG: DUF4232 domain-containing protein [Gaiellales bacterium]
MITKRVLTVVVGTAVAASVCAVLPDAAAGQPAAARCHASQLVGKVRQASGAAGTIALSISFRNVSPRACAVEGFPRLRLRQAGHALPTSVRHGGLAFLERPAHRVTVQPGKVATLLVAYSDVPVGSETHCRMADALVVHLDAGSGRVRVPAEIGACGHGRLYESPFLAGRVDVA